MEMFPTPVKKFRGINNIPTSPIPGKMIKGCPNFDMVQWLMREHTSRQRFRETYNNVNVGYILHETVLRDLQDRLDLDPQNESLQRQLDVATALLCNHVIHDDTNSTTEDSGAISGYHSAPQRKRRNQGGKFGRFDR